MPTGSSLLVFAGMRRVLMLCGLASLVGIGPAWSAASQGAGEPFLLRNLIDRLSSASETIMLRAVCDQGDIRIQNGTARCAVCPTYTTDAGATSGFEIVEATLGTFTEARKNEALLNMQGCESQSERGGGMVLLRETGSGWQRLQYRRGYRLRDCLKFRAATSIYPVLCNQSSYTQGTEIGELVWVSMEGNEFDTSTLMHWFDNMGSNPRQLVTVFPYRLLRSDFNQDGRSDLRILVRVRQADIPGNFAGALDALERGYRLPEPKVLTLTYLFDGLSLKLHKESRNAFEEITALLQKHIAAETP